MGASVPTLICPPWTTRLQPVSVTAIGPSLVIFTLASQPTLARLTSSEAAAMLINLAWSSAAALAMAPLQDLLNLGNDARMNLPGRAEGN